MVTGGAAGVDPSYYGGGAYATVITKDRRPHSNGVTQALAANKPVLGICGGQRLLASCWAAKLSQHPRVGGRGARPRAGHRAERPHNRRSPGHAAAQIVSADELAVNSAHHQAAGAPAAW